MITCPNCAHPNPDVATQCEACYTPLPATTQCASCGATVSTAAEFCGQCGSTLQHQHNPSAAVPPTIVGPSPPASVVSAVAPAETSVSSPVASASSSSAAVSAQTQLQAQVAKLLHIQSDTTLELPGHLDVIHIGKANDRIPPDLDLSHFADADIVSRIHADIRVSGSNYYLEDVGSTNGTYINNQPLRPGDRHRLRPGDRIALGKGDKVSFLFQIS